ncbi:MAG: hypothetical protein D6695_10220 [Planctomycetota bacterium]|nr:MAG: hypothetical protein D6695_10220 [Planctomycetota bacterium]
MVAITLMGALIAISIPLVLDRTRDISFDETLAQIERVASVVRADAQRRSEALALECRWSEEDQLVRIGVVKLEQNERESTGSVFDLPFNEGVGRVDASVEMMPSFDVMLTLAKGYELRRRIPEMYFDRAGEALLQTETTFGDLQQDEMDPVGFDMDASQDDGWGELDHPPRRLVIAVFLPDGSLMGEERLYLLGPGGRVGAITMSRWLGRVRAERVNLSMTPGGELDEASGGGEALGPAPEGSAGGDTSTPEDAP